MAQAGRRHSLVIYRALMNRWWPATLSIAAGLGVLAWAVWRKNPLNAFRWQGLVICAGIMLALTVALYIFRGMAYVQAFPTHIKLKTPFLQINISYKRLQRYISTEFRTLFPPNKLRGWKRDLIAPLSSKTALVLELSGWPIDPRFIHLFLSPFFFKYKDKTAHFVILVDNWMGLSAEIDSKRNAPKETPSQPRVDRSILGKLPRRDK